MKYKFVYFSIYLSDELANLKDYCERMKETFWPDWDDLLRFH